MAEYLKCPSPGCEFKPKLQEMPCPNCGDYKGGKLDLFSGLAVNTTDYTRPVIECKSCKTAFEYISCPKCSTQIRQTSSCFITTACCETMDLPDDCYELTAFRNFRDNWLINQGDGKLLIREYYKIAPEIIRTINAGESPKDVYSEIWNKHLKICLSYIEEGEFEKCKDSYTNMVEHLKRKYSIMTQPTQCMKRRS